MKYCRCFCVEVVKHIPVHRYSVDIFFHIRVLQKSGILGSDRQLNTAEADARGVRIVAFSISSHVQTQ